MIKPKLLIVAQDYATGQSFLPLAYAPAFEAQYNIHWLLAPPASNFFSLGAQAHIVPPNNFHELPTLLDTINPDILLTGISGAGIGLDEFTIHHFKGKIPTFSYQDFWGYVNTSSGTHADTILVMDDNAAALTQPHAPTAHIIKVGCLKKIALRKEHQTLQKPEAEKHGWAFIGQPLWHLKSYKEIIIHLQKLAEDHQQELIYIQHPAENPSAEEMQTLDIHVLKSGRTRVEKLNTLLRQDKIFTCFSTMMHDLIVLKEMNHDKKPDLFALFIHQDIIDYYAAHSGGLIHFPLENAGVHEIENLSQLETYINTPPLLPGINDDILDDPVENIISIINSGLSNT